MHPRVRNLIDTHCLLPHPEGGYYRETFRSPHVIQPLDLRAERVAITAIYFLLETGQKSRWHRLQSDEIWTHLEGGPLALYTFDPERSALTCERLGVLGEDIEPMRVVRKGLWQAARPMGEFALLGTVVSPGFEFEDFCFASDLPAVAQALRAHSPEAESLLL